MEREKIMDGSALCVMWCLWREMNMQTLKRQFGGVKICVYCIPFAFGVKDCFVNPLLLV